MWTKIGRAIAVLAVIVILLAGAGSYVTWNYFIREVPVQQESPEDTYQYGSLGNEQRQGLPYWIWLVLPRVFPEYLPTSGGYTAFDVTWEVGQELPVGFSKKTIGYPRVSPTCATCHSDTIRQVSENQTTLIPTGSTNRFDWQGYVEFLNDSASDPRFEAGYLLNEMAYNHKFSLIERLLYRYKIIPETKQRILADPEAFIWIEPHPAVKEITANQNL